MSGAPKRSVRVGERIRSELMDLLLRGGVGDPRAAGAWITRVEVTDDLGIARVYLRLTDPQSSERQQRDVVKAFVQATGFLRREIGHRVQLKYTPKLEFFWDEGVDRKRRVEEILAEIAAERGDTPDED